MTLSFGLFRRFHSRSARRIERPSEVVLVPPKWKRLESGMFVNLNDTPEAENRILYGMDKDEPDDVSEWSGLSTRR